MASWQDASAASQQLELDAVGRQLLAAALNTNPAPHEIPVWPHATLANPTRRNNLNIVNTYSIIAEGGVNFCKRARQKNIHTIETCLRKEPVVPPAKLQHAKEQASVLLAAVAVSRPGIAPKNAVAPAKI